MTERRLILIAVGFFIAVGSGIGLYGFFHWVIPFIDSPSPWLVHLERTTPRAVGLAIGISLIIAFWVLMALWARYYIKRVRAALRAAGPANERGEDDVFPAVEEEGMTQLVHVEVAYDKPGLCPECLNLEITGRGGGKVQLIERKGKWVCPLSGPSLAQQRVEQGIRVTGF